MSSIFSRNPGAEIREIAGVEALPARWSGRWKYYGLALLLVAAATTVCQVLP